MQRFFIRMRLELMSQLLDWFLADVTRFNVGFDFATIPSSPCLSHPFRHRFWVQLAELKNADIEQMEKIISIITCEITSGQCVRKLVFGADIFNLDLRLPIDSVRKQIKRNSVGSGDVSHCRTSALEDHLDHCFIIFKNVEHRTRLRSFTFEETQSTLHNSRSLY